MKRLLFFILSISIAFLFTSCSSSESPAGNPNPDKDDTPSASRTSGVLGNQKLSTLAPDYQCMMRRTIGNLLYTCSGTFISDNVFLTAAHCISFEDLFSNEQQTNFYKIHCFNGFKTSVKSLHIHPYYYQRNNWLPSTPDLYYPDNGIQITNAYNDIAIIITDNNFPSSSNLPNIASKDEFLGSDYPKSCRTLGFSTKYCKRKTGEGCFRENIELTQSTGSDWQCDLVTGDKCQISAPSLAMLSNGHSLMLNSLDPSLSKGDSGSGIICDDSNGLEYLLGVYVRTVDDGIVSVPLKNEFINVFLAEESSKRHLQPRGLVLEPRYAEMYGFFDIFRNLEKIGKSAIGQFDEPHYFNSRKLIPPPKYHEIFSQFRDWVNDNPDEAERIFREKKIGLVDFGFDLSLSQKDFFRRSYPYKVLTFDWRADIDDVIELLQK